MNITQLITNDLSLTYHSIDIRMRMAIDPSIDTTISNEVAHLYCPKSWSYVGISLSVIAACLYICAMFLCIFYHPGSVLLSALLPIMAVLAMLKGKPLWMWCLVALIFLAMGVFSLFYNDIIGPMTFMICDRPFDVPAQWGHCYRLFWSAALFKIVASRAGILSILVMSGILLYKRYRKACEDLEV